MLKKERNEEDQNNEEDEEAVARSRQRLSIPEFIVGRKYAKRMVQHLRRKQLLNKLREFEEAHPHLVEKAEAGPGLKRSRLLIDHGSR